MNNGAFAFLDCLGFKGLWNRPGVVPEDIVRFLENAKAGAPKIPLVSTIQANIPNIEQSVIFISDTIAISTHLRTTPAQPELAAGYITLLTAHLAIELCIQFASAPVPLLFRGTIAHGHHIARDSFVLGPVVDEAAQLAEAAQGAFVWITPEAKSLLHKWQTFQRSLIMDQIDKYSPAQRVEYINKSFASLRVYSPTLSNAEMERIIAWWGRLTKQQQELVSDIVLRECWRPTRDDGLISNYPVEMKPGGTLVVDVVNPLFRVEPQDHQAWIDKALGTFTGNAVDIMLKKQNTERFLKHASSVTTSAVVTTRENIQNAQQEAERITGIRL